MGRVTNNVMLIDLGIAGLMQRDATRMCAILPACQGVTQVGHSVWRSSTNYATFARQT